MGATWRINTGDCRRAFVVLEFAVKNDYPKDATIGRFMIDDWVFAGQYTPAMDDQKRDYRAFDGVPMACGSSCCKRHTVQNTQPFALSAKWSSQTSTRWSFRRRVVRFAVR
jgi:hypothetical protein